VQGKGAAESIAHAINGLGAHPDVDVIIAGRGGGSLQDLWAFNEEVLLRAIANCNVPVISAVGHEIDTPLSDLVADARATTPTAAGELAVQKFEDLQFTLVHHTEKLHRALSATIGGRRDALKSLEGRLGDPLRLVAEQHQALDDLSGGLTRAMREAIVLARERRVRASARLRNLHPSTRIQMAQSQLRALRRRCTGQGRMLLEQRRRRLSELGHSLDLLSPAANLERGYAIVRDDQGRVLQHAEDVSKGDGLSVILHRGTLDVQVETVHPESDLEQ